jgi:hypothetical protein
VLRTDLQHWMCTIRDIVLEQVETGANVLQLAAGERAPRGA